MLVPVASGIASGQLLSNKPRAEVATHSASPELPGKTLAKWGRILGVPNNMIPMFWGM